MPTLVITSINPANQALRSLAAGCVRHGWKFLLAGDTKSPDDFALDGCEFLSIRRQQESGFQLAQLAPVRSYTRKNIAYLAAIRDGAECVVETDDDNHPKDDFWQPRELTRPAHLITANGWVNAYGYFTETFIYPRGLPLDRARDTPPPPGILGDFQCPVQQGLADADPDVDAVFRMLHALPIHFEPNASVLLGPGAWCPFNSQNTTFFPQAFPLMYLPAHCSFRMTDIWRSFVAQRILHEIGAGVLFHQPTVWQERNAHDLMKDFADELPGYLHNQAIREVLLDLNLDAASGIQRMMEICYEALIPNGWVGAQEESLLQAWFADLRGIQT
jgi:hypothetical protein